MQYAIKEYRLIEVRIRLSFAGLAMGSLASIGSVPSHDRISDVKDENWGVWPVAEVIRHIRLRLARFYVDDGLLRAYVEIHGDGASEWIQTERDGRPTNNLLYLPRF